MLFYECIVFRKAFPHIGLMNDLDYVIRFFTGVLPEEFDIDALHSGIRRSFGFSPSRHDQLRHFIVEDAANNVIGYARAAATEKYWHIITIWVERPHRRCGIGSRLASAICDAAYAEGSASVMLIAKRKPTWHFRFFESLDFYELPPDATDAAIKEIRKCLHGYELQKESAILEHNLCEARNVPPPGLPVFRVRDGIHREIGLLEAIRQRNSPPDILARFGNLAQAGSPFGAIGDELIAHRLWVIADENDSPAGFVIIGEADGFAHIREMVIAPGDYESLAGANLAEAICSWALRAGYGGVSVAGFRSRPIVTQILRDLGFSEAFESNFGPHLRAIAAAERQAGIPAHSRIIMSRSFSAVRF